MDDTDLDRTLVADPHATGSAPRRTPPVLGRGDVLGRYVVIDVLGSGGMGVVYAAHDPELDRRVAIKLLRPVGDHQPETFRDRERLLREAQALARLRHPNVITVHDVGEHQGRIFVAMEHIDGPTLGQWVRQAERSWQEIVDVFCRAGRGLQAVHAERLVHRDFKPDNVMLECGKRVERVIVMDFGLATSAVSLHEETSASAGSASEHPSGPSTSSARLTRTGTVMGTPAYMAPEQHAGERADHRTDQFSFCVAFYEALYGSRPFGGETVAELSVNCTLGVVQEPPAGSTVPGWVREIVFRGLSVDPDDRWPSMEALIDALSRDPTRNRRRLVVVGSLLAVAGLVYATREAIERQRLAECRGLADSIEEIWNDDVAARVEEAVLGTELSYAQDTWTRLRPLIDGLAEQWRTNRYDACTEELTLPAELRPIQRECFEMSQVALANRLELLEAADTAMINGAIVWNRDDAPDPCLDSARLRSLALLPRDPDGRARVTGLSHQLTRSALLRSAGRYDEALALADEGLAEARALENEQLIAWALSNRGSALFALSRLEDAERAYEEAFFVARETGDDHRAGWAARILVSVVGHDLAREEDGRRWARHAQILLRNTGSTEFDRATLDQFMGMLELSAGHYDTALERLGRVLTIYEREVGLQSKQSLETLMAMAVAHDRLGDLDRATAMMRRILSTSEEFYGALHPEVARASNNVGVALINGRHFEQAEPYIQRALEIYEAAGLQSHMGSSLDNLVLITREAGRLEEALGLSERVLRLRRETLPADHHLRANALVNHGQVLSAMGRGAAALEDFEAALGIYERSLGPEHPRVADASQLIVMERAWADPDADLLPILERILRIRRAALPPGHVGVADAAAEIAQQLSKRGEHAEALELLGSVVDEDGDATKASTDLRLRLLLHGAEALVATGQVEEASRRLDLATALLKDAELRQLDRGDIDFALARVLWALGRDRGEVRRLARRAMHSVRESRPAVAAHIERWLVEHEHR